MATVAMNVLVDGLRGKLGDSLVFRTMRGKTFLSPCARKPGKKKESEAQRNTRVNFRQAAEWAHAILLDPEKKAYYRQRAKALKLPNAYTAAITDYMRKPKVIKTQHRETITYQVHKPGFTLKEVKAEFADNPDAPPLVVTRQKNETWLLEYTPDDRTTSTATLFITDNALQKTQFQMI